MAGRFEAPGGCGKRNGDTSRRPSTIFGTGHCYRSDEAAVAVRVESDDAGSELGAL